MEFLHAPNLDAMTRFYQLALGAELGAADLAGVKVNRLRAGETGLGLFDASEKQFTGVPHITRSTLMGRATPKN